MVARIGLLNAEKLKKLGIELKIETNEGCDSKGDERVLRWESVVDVEKS